MEGDTVEKKDISFEKFSEIFLDISFDEEQFFEMLKNKKSNLLKPLNGKCSKTIYFEYDKDICKVSNITSNPRELEEIHWNKKIIEVDEEKINFLNDYTKGNIH